MHGYEDKKKMNTLRSTFFFFTIKYDLIIPRVPTIFKHFCSTKTILST